MKEIAAVANIEQERLFGNGVDLFKNYYAVLGICNILENIGVRTSHDSDWFRAVAEYLTVYEVSELYDKIIPPPETPFHVRKNQFQQSPGTRRR